MKIKYNLIKTDGKARLGELITSRGTFLTPMFMPVGTLANVKLLTKEDLNKVQANIILANTYHLWLKPGIEIIKKAGGLHKFMNYEKPILTDSGGFQVFSLAKKKDISEEGVKFKSHLDGSNLFLTPEKSMEIQNVLASDIAMCFDECPPFPVSHEYMKQSVERTLRWAKRCQKAHINKQQALFGIVQGGEYKDIREYSAKETVKLNFEGYSIGGVSVGEDQLTKLKMIDYGVKYLPKDKVRYLMGVGEPIDILEGVERGIDIFDCVLPTRLARHGNALTKQGRINLRNKQFADDFNPIADDCDCYTCQTYSKAYLRHLFNSREGLGASLLSIHNVRFLTKLMGDIQTSLKEGNFQEFKNSFISNYN